MGEYRIDLVTHDRWILISHDEWDCEDSEAFVHMVTHIASALCGKIKNVGPIQYQIDTDPFHLTYQWDSLFGIVVIFPDSVRETDATTFLEDILNPLQKDN